MSQGFGWTLLAVGVYGLLHSLLASLGVKALACRLGGAAARRLYRLGFNLFAAVSFVPVLALVVLLPDRPIYAVPSPWNWVMRAGQFLAVVGLAAGLLHTDLGSFAGLSQLSGADDSLCNPEGHARSGGLVTGGLYRFMRHPLYTFGLLFIWLSPTLTWNTLALNLGLTAYILIGAKLEERKLLVEFGEAYRAYQKRTPMLVPGMRFK